MLVKTSQLLKKSIMFVALLSLLTGIIYPALVTVLAQLLFNDKANGSYIIHNDKVVGSSLIGQAFSSPKYFWGRPSATTPYPYNATNSMGSNLSPGNPALMKIVETRIADLTKANPNANNHIPMELITASASGLDPHITLDGALYQAPRVAKARNMEASVLELMVRKIAVVDHLNWLGYAKVNVLQLNLLLDSLNSNKHAEHNGTTIND